MYTGPPTQSRHTNPFPGSPLLELNNVFHNLREQQRHANCEHTGDQQPDFQGYLCPIHILIYLIYIAYTVLHIYIKNCEPILPVLDTLPLPTSVNRWKVMPDMNRKITNGKAQIRKISVNF
ncbi:predicted protein [Methanosarcina acetivorans C2A]|uniref:Uncharacterized protein n=1 Tax=Methanosarcina acetivorans (strain ATCC 35395 / DSM 2834 / JCM 12185 / C2A) TaxID=188937 RepID=Q8TU07_METAC|nr:predicted protein [Methanosarcina acetivorans C2A]